MISQRPISRLPISATGRAIPTEVIPVNVDACTNVVAPFNSTNVVVLAESTDVAVPFESTDIVIPFNCTNVGAKCRA